MANLLSTGVSGLLAFQRALDTTGHNISNVGTPGYSRQRTEFGAREPQAAGNGYVGRGVDVTTIRRVYDDHLAAQVRSNSSNVERLDAYRTNAERLNNLFSSTTTGLTTSLQKFVNAFQGVANAPTSVPARQVLLSEANALRERLVSYDERLAQMDGEVNQRIAGEVDEVNALAQGIARLNSQITDGFARTGQPPNDLLDQRDQLLDELSSKINVSVMKQDGGIVNVFVGSGQPLVLNATATDIVTQPDPFDPSRVGVSVRSDTGLVDITGNMTGGSVGGLLDFRREQLDPAHNTLGRISAGLAEVVNAQHRAGMDLHGEMGEDLFALGNVEVLERSTNSGGASIDVARTSASALTNSDYILENTAGGWTLRNSLTGAPVTMTGSGTVADPFVADGMSMVVSGAADADDEFLIRPTRGVVGGLEVLVEDPESIAAAAPIRSSVNGANTGTGAISAGTVLTAEHANLLDPVEIQFTSGSTFSVNGGPDQAYTSGDDININGWRVQITGSPAAGDRFNVEPNGTGVGDNRNALALAQALQRPVLDGSTSSLSSTIGRFVGGIGVVTKQAQVNQEAQQAVYNESVSARDNVSGVNLDEEAANLLKYQQAYQAAAQVIRVADAMFQTMLDALRR